ncbi:hypothetical protein J421_3174 [Gemmatirosa kalamazoonensis]|uniref:Lipoprotein n=1 Tax=Gemmatirosa kalamazoonensis TaxID=861299 RepID=W0RIX1_9BACT|nr:hypothetical protein [Gemmatirosa kalamazoonensis]AHG90711.1 hypothetical protein J421_3174 [Gemmatirosa kalamazoonensis]
MPLLPSRRPATPTAAPRALRSVAAVAFAGLALTACGGTDPFAPVAAFETAAVTYQVYPLTTAPATLPAAISLYGLSSVRPIVRTNLSLNFDVAVDLDASGKVRLLPPKLVVAPQGVSLTTGMQIIANTTFDALTRAPNSGYQFDSATVVTPGQVVAVQTQGAGPLSAACATTVPMYAKLVVDSIRPANGSQVIYMRARVDQNCGFRSLEPGLPSS